MPNRDAAPCSPSSALPNALCCLPVGLQGNTTETARRTPAPRASFQPEAQTVFRVTAASPWCQKFREILKEQISGRQRLLATTVSLSLSVGHEWHRKSCGKIHEQQPPGPPNIHLAEVLHNPASLLKLPLDLLARSLLGACSLLIWLVLLQTLHADLRYFRVRNQSNKSFTISSIMSITARSSSLNSSSSTPNRVAPCATLFLLFNNL